MLRFSFEHLENFLKPISACSFGSHLFGVCEWKYEYLLLSIRSLFNERLASVFFVVMNAGLPRENGCAGVSISNLVYVRFEIGDVI